MLSSPRRRRRLLWLTGLGAVAAGVALTVVYVRDTARSYETPVRQGQGRGDTYDRPAVESLSPRSRAAAQATAYNFVRTAVLRQELETAWALAAPSLKEGYTLEEWMTGDIPVIPYPADLKRLRFQFEYSYEDVLGIAIGLWPKPGAKEDPITFRMELIKAGPGSRRIWVVSSWAPPGVPLEVLALRAQKAATKRGTPISAETARGQTLSAVWLAIPGALLLCVILVPVILGTRHWYRGRRAVREYEAARAESERS